MVIYIFKYWGYYVTKYFKNFSFISIIEILNGKVAFDMFTYNPIVPFDFTVHYVVFEPTISEETCLDEFNIIFSDENFYYNHLEKFLADEKASQEPFAEKIFFVTTSFKFLTYLKNNFNLFQDSDFYEYVENIDRVMKSWQNPDTTDHSFIYDSREIVFGDI